MSKVILSDDTSNIIPNIVFDDPIKPNIKRSKKRPIRRKTTPYNPIDDNCHHDSIKVECRENINKILYNQAYCYDCICRDPPYSQDLRCPVWSKSGQNSGAVRLSVTCQAPCLTCRPPQMLAGRHP